MSEEFNDTALEVETDDMRFRETVLAFLETAKKIDPEWSQSRLARMADVSTAVLSGLLKGDYRGNVEENQRKVIAIIDREKGKFSQSIKKPSFVATKLFNLMRYQMNIAAVDVQIQIFTGNAGIGKTEALRAYCRENPSVIFIEANSTFSDRTVLERIAEAIGIEPRGKKDRLMDNIIQKLKGTERMIIIDEAEYLPVKSLDNIRRIYDLAEIAIILCGMPRLYRNIIAVKEPMRQISSRMIHTNLNEIDKEDARSIIETVLHNPASEIVDRLYDITRGNARELTKLMLIAQRLAIYNHTNITLGIINKAREKLL